MAIQQLGDGNSDGVRTPDVPHGFYGATPIAQRSGAAQATSLVGTASSADVTSDFKAAVIEIMNTLTALGLWNGGA
jgi:hypothetical protein